MVKKVLKGMCAFGVSFVLLSQSVLAASGKVTGNNVRIREKADSKAPEISVATKGETVEVIGEEGNWYQVNFENVTGYISKDYVDTDYAENSQAAVTEIPTEPETPPQEPVEENPTEEIPEVVSEEPSQEPEVTVNSAEIQDYVENQTVTFEQDTALRYLPNFSSRTSGIASSSATYTVKASLNNWIKVVNDTNSGWVLKTSVQENTTDVIPQEPTPDPSEPEPTPDTSASVSKGKTNVDSARIRQEPDGAVIDTLDEGTEVTILGEENGWYQISVGEYNGCYIAKRLVTEI